MDLYYATPYLYISMGKKVKHIRIRITEAQFRCLTRVIIQEQKNKSQIIRNAINAYLIENYIRDETLEKEK
jgi:metal-responsive CopG/Arc/MetJ family transcriptional regulator